MIRTSHLPTGVTRLDDGRYRVRVSKRFQLKPTRRFRECTLPATSTIKEVEKKKLELRELLDNEAADVNLLPRGITVADYAAQWLARKELKPSTRSRYEQVVHDRIVPHIGHIKVRELTRPQVEAALRQLAAAQRTDPTTGMPIGLYAKATVDGWFRVVLQLVRDAAADFERPDPTRRLKTTVSPNDRPRTRELRTLSVDQLELWLETARQCAPQWFPVFTVLARTGMRASEALALHCGDLDFGTGVIRVHWNISKGELVPTSKTGWSREVPFDSELQRVLRGQIRGRSKDSLVFTTAGGLLRTHAVLRKPAMQVGSLAGIPLKVGPQVLRRTFNTLALDAGVDPLLLQAMMGHSSMALTSRYAGFRPEQKLSAVSFLPPVGVCADTAPEDGDLV